MSYRKPEQIESCRSAVFQDENKPWARMRTSKGRGFLKRCIHRAERQRCREDVLTDPRYKKYHGTEY